MLSVYQYFKLYLRKTAWVIGLITLFLIYILNNQFLMTENERHISSVDSGLSAKDNLELLIKNLNQKIDIFALQYADLIYSASTNATDAEKLLELSKQYFNLVNSVVITSDDGENLLSSLSLNSEFICKNDVDRFILGINRELKVHEESSGKSHFDILSHWQYKDKKGVFMVLVDIDLITDILAFQQPRDYFFYLVNKYYPENIVLTIEGNHFNKKSHNLSELDVSMVALNTDIAGSNWSLLMIENKAITYPRWIQNTVQVGVIIAIFVITILIALWRFSVSIRHSQQLANAHSNQTQKHQLMLKSLVEGTASSTGNAFFYSFVKELSNYFAVNKVLVAIKSKNSPNEYRTMAFWSINSYKMSASIWVDAALFNEDHICLHESDFDHHYNDLFQYENKAYISGILASQICNNRGSIVGLVAVLSSKPLQLTNAELDVLRVFVSRAEAELDRKQAEEELLEAKEKSHISLESIADGVITTNINSEINYMNPAAEKMTGWSEELAIDLKLSSVFYLEDEITGVAIPDPAKHCIEERRIISPKTDNVLISKNTKRLSIKGSASPMYGANSECIGAVIVFHDVTQSREMEKLMAFQASHDSLTGLVNRSEFESRLEAAFNSSKNHGHEHILLFLDLDQFKIVNDTAGHIAGDELLVQIANLLLDQLRGRDTLGRLGGDEFSVLLEHCPVQEAKNIAQNLINVIKEHHFIWEKKTYQIGVSIGLVPVNKSSLSTVQILTQADLACYTAKDKGRSQVHVFDEDDADVAERHRELLRAADLKQAIKEHRFELLYQPIICLDKGDQKMHGEVLLRMLDHDNEYILPGAFIPAAERYGIMGEIDKWVLNKVFTDFVGLFQQNEDLLLSINLSGNSFSDDSLLPTILELFETSGVSPKQVCFEITETAAISSLKQLNAFIKKLKVKGCTFALDDFGSGLSSFNYLKTMDVDYLKIDGHFVRDLRADEIDRAMVHSINEMGHILGIKTIAECADDQETINILKEMGVDFAQGYYLGELVSMKSLIAIPKESDELGSHVIN